MSRFFRAYWRPIAAIIGLGIISLVASVIILENQRFYLPKWVPFLGRDLVTYQAKFSTAQSVTPGQGQIVTIAGVRIGDITGVELVDGRADVEMKIERRYMYLLRQDAQALLRPKTGLKDMTLDIRPGSQEAPAALPGYTIPVAQTAPNVDVDEFLSALDGDTRGYLQLLLAAGSEGLEGRGRDLGDGLRQFDPVSRDLRAATDGLAARRRNISGGVTSLKEITGALADQRGDVNELISASADVFGAFANEEASLRRGLRDLPPALRDTRGALASTQTLAEDLRPAAQDLRPLARELRPALRAVRPFVRRSEPVVRRQLLPFTRETLPTIRDVRAASRDLNRAIPDTVSALKTVNELTNILAYDPPGEEEGYLFYFGWVNHLGANIFANQDAAGPVRRGQLIASCTSLGNLNLAPVLEPILGPVLDLTNPPSATDIPACTQTQAIGRGVRISDSPPSSGSDASEDDEGSDEASGSATSRSSAEAGSSEADADRSGSAEAAGSDASGEDAAPATGTAREAAPGAASTTTTTPAPSTGGTP